MEFLCIENIVKRYGQLSAADRVSFTVAKGECVALLGPSGCGKTTLLNIVAGFIRPDSGDVRIAGKRITETPPHRRDMGMVFQDYALFPHLSVVENVEFGLRMRGVQAIERRRMAEKALDLVSLSGLGERGAHQLSGGQQQRVAVARALAIEPRLLLFDEPLSNLDARLRDTMRTEIRALLTRTGITSLFVTHDQAEAFVVADRIVVMNAGRVEQSGMPGEIYERPASRYVASFLGSCNLVPGRILDVVAASFTVEALGTRLCAARHTDTSQHLQGSAVTLAIRPHHIDAASGDMPQAENRVTGTVDNVEYLGSITRATVRHVSGVTLAVEARGGAEIAKGDEVALTWSAANTWVLPDATPA